MTGDIAEALGPGTYDELTGKVTYGQNPGPVRYGQPLTAEQAEAADARSWPEMQGPSNLGAAAALGIEPDVIS